MNLESVLNQYADRILRLHNKAHLAKRPLTENEKKGIAFYKSAAHSLSVLVDQGPVPTGGFVMREYAPQHMRFAPAKEKPPQEGEE